MYCDQAPNQWDWNVAPPSGGLCMSSVHEWGWVKLSVEREESKDLGKKQTNKKLAAKIRYTTGK